MRTAEQFNDPQIFFRDFFMRPMKSKPKTVTKTAKSTGIFFSTTPNTLYKYFYTQYILKILTDKNRCLKYFPCNFISSKKMFTHKFWHCMNRWMRHCSMATLRACQCLYNCVDIEREKEKERDGIRLKWKNERGP